jgi:Mn2+/Fe2+ NRAMP family transporter
MKAGVAKRILGVVTLLVGTVVTATLALLIQFGTTYGRQAGEPLFTIAAVIVALLTLVVTIALFRSASRDAERKPRGLDESA